MTATIRNLTTVLQLFFPGELPLKRAILVLITLIAVYPLLRLHNNQRRRPRQPRRTAWLKSIGVILMRAFHPERADPEAWTGQGPGTQYANDMLDDISVVFNFLGLGEEENLLKLLTPPSHPIICTTRLNCVFCPLGNYPNTLRQRARMQEVSLLDETLTWVHADLLIGHCPSCQSDYYPDRITYRGADGERLQKLEYDTPYFRVAKQGVWVHSRVALMQENALLRFHAGWSNYAEWLNKVSTGSKQITYRQSQRLFIEHFSRRLLMAHNRSNSFTCPAHPTAQILAREVRDIIGRDGGSIASAMKHGCADCTHQKRYRSDLINEGAVLATRNDGVADENDTEGGDDVSEFRLSLQLDI